MVPVPLVHGSTALEQTQQKQHPLSVPHEMLRSSAEGWRWGAAGSLTALTGQGARSVFAGVGVMP